MYPPQPHLYMGTISAGCGVDAPPLLWAPPALPDMRGMPDRDAVAFDTGVVPAAACGETRGSV